MGPENRAQETVSDTSKQFGPRLKSAAILRVTVTHRLVPYVHQGNEPSRQASRKGRRARVVT